MKVTLQIVDLFYRKLDVYICLLQLRMRIFRLPAAGQVSKKKFTPL